MNHAISAMLLIVAFIHLMPLVGVLGVERLQQLYGLSVGEPNLQILMRHRAVLFGILGAFLAYAAFKPGLQLLAVIAGFLSVCSFLFLAYAVGDYNEELGRIVRADWVALLCLIVALTLLIQQQ